MMPKTFGAGRASKEPVTQEKKHRKTKSRVARAYAKSEHILCTKRAGGIGTTR